MVPFLFQASGLYSKELKKGSGTSQDQSLLASLPGMVMSGYIQAGFDPEYALIFTWYRLTRNSATKV